jgi:autotransporter-associated beta strand protein
MSSQWQQLFGQGASEANGLGLQLNLAAGPGWCGTGGPWITPAQSMQHLVASETNVSGPVHFNALLPQPQPRTPFFGTNTLTGSLYTSWKNYYQDVVVLAFPTPGGSYRIADTDEKTLYYRPSVSSGVGTKPFLPAPAYPQSVSADQCIATNQIIELTANLSLAGNLVWDVPAGSWTILRFGRTTTGQTSRPAPPAGLGFESDKFDPAALDTHFNAYIGTILNTIGPLTNVGSGWTMLHFDSWEMSSQNWSGVFRAEFQQRRGYDPLLYLPVMTGRVVGNSELSQRFLWDLRQTAQELVITNHLQHLKQLGAPCRFGLSIEPYDLDPCSDLELGGVADVPQGEFWAQGYGYATEYSCVEAASIAHTMGRPICGAESFTASSSEAWRLYPGAMKTQADWALCCGINRLTFHRYQHQPWLDRWPGMTFGQYGVHWERTQTWWDMAPAFHGYLSRCQQMLRRGLQVADILYLAPEGAPHVFLPPNSAMEGSPPDRLGYNFDGCAPSALLTRASVQNGRIVFPDGMSYRVLVLPEFDTMTPALLGKIYDLVQAGVTVIGAPPRKSPSLSNYPACDQQVSQLSAALWGPGQPPPQRSVGSGLVVFDPLGGRVPADVTADLSSARWIWYPEGNPVVSAPVASRSFQKSFVIPAGLGITSATMAITADNSFQLSVNGQAVLSGNNFTVNYLVGLTAFLVPGTNLLQVTATNGGTSPNPAGLIAVLSIQLSDGSTLSVVSDSSWSAALTATGPWQPAPDLGVWNMSPWNKTASSPVGLPEIYPDYSLAAQVLLNAGVPPDFQADGTVRYIHRQDGGTNLYFVASRTNVSHTVQCQFRVTGRQPEWWNPLTGETRLLPSFTQTNGITTLPLQFDPYESAFIVFQTPVVQTNPPGPNYSQVGDLVTVAPPWQVSFDTNWGGPASITFTNLDDWSTRPEPGIKYYSGKAVYRTTFDFNNPGALAQSSVFSLSLGDVENLASVTLNGQTLGTAWCAPWRVQIPPTVLQARSNLLEITVANLWPNRLIGDQFLPATNRFCWAAWDPYTTNSALLTSGLLGPVTVQSPYNDLVWSGALNGLWDVNDSANTNWRLSGWGTPVCYAESTNVTGSVNAVVFDDTASLAKVMIGAAVSPLSVTVSNNSLAYSFSGPGKITGATGLVKQGAGRLTVATANDYTGDTAVSGGTLILGATNALPSGSGKGNLTLGGTLDLAGFSPTLNGLNGGGVVDNLSAGGNPVLTVGAGDADGAFSGALRNTTGILGVTKVGGGTFTLSGTNTYSGATVVQQGILAVQGSTSSLVSGLVAYWPFDGAPTDLSGNHLDLTLAGSPTYTSGRYGQALRLTGSSQTASISYNSLLALNSYSVSLWIYLTNYPPVGTSYNTIATWNSTYKYGFDIQVWNNQGALFVHGDVGSGTNWLSTSVDMPAVTPSLNAWHLITYVIDNTTRTFNLYYDGALKNTIGFSGTPLLLRPGPPLLLRGDNGSFVVDEARIYNRALSASDIADLYANNGAARNGGRLPNATPVSVAQGALLDLGGTTGNFSSLSGAGTVTNGAVTVSGVLSPGDAVGSLGTLTLCSNLTITGNVSVEVNKSQALSNDFIIVGGVLTNGGAGTLTVAKAGGGPLAAGDTFKLFNQPLPNGRRLAIAGPPGVIWTNKLEVDGSIAVVLAPPISSSPTNLIYAINGSILRLSWPEDHRSWILQSNPASLTVTSAWYDCPGTETLTNLDISTARAATNVFFRLLRPW